LENQDKVIFLGGDHSISYSIGRAFLDYCEKNKKEPCLIVFDAHADCMDTMKNPTHEEWLRALIEKGFPKENVLLIGARNIDKREIEFLSKNKIKQISVNELTNNLEEITDVIMEFGSGKQVYVSFDIDVVDASFVKETGHAELGGLTSRQTLYVVGRISLMRNLKAFDLVEVDCEKNKKDGENNLSIKLAGKILAELV